MKKLIASILALVMVLSLCACGASQSAPAVTAAPVAETTAEPAAAAEETAVEAEDPMAAYRTGSPWPCIDLEGVVTEDMDADPKNNFVLSVSRDFYLNAVIPEEYPSVGTFSDVSVINDSELLALFSDDNSFESHDSQLAKKLYDLILDWDSRNALGVTPLKSIIEPFEAISGIDELTEYYLTCPSEKILPQAFSVSYNVDLADPDSYCGALGTIPLMLQDSAEYSERTEIGELLYGALKKLTLGMLAKLGYSEERALEIFENGYKFETMIAPYYYTSDERNSPDYISKVSNPYTRDEIIARAGKLPVIEYFEGACGYPKFDKWYCYDKGFYEAMQDIYTDEYFPLIRDWTIARAARTYADALDRECYDLSLECESDLSGTVALPDEINAAHVVAGMLCWQTSRLYCETYFTQQDKDEMNALIQQIIGIYKEMLMSESFISEETKQKAIEKIEALKIRTLYPDNWSDYANPNLDFKSAAEGGSFFDAVMAIAADEIKTDRELAGKPVDHSRWSDFTNPIVVNCFYNPSDNSINILSAICRGDIYRSDMSFEEKCAKMGVIIAHEITHAFDSSGAQFDKDGAFSNWWTDEDKVLFEEKVQKLADYFSSMTAWEGTNLNGGIMTGEACADMGAIRCMLNLASRTDGFDYDRFFKSYADLWKTKENMFIILYRQTDVHPMGYLRINAVLQQFDEFLDFYGIKPGDGMYLAPEDRVAIW